jgi:hypothetical protein
MVHSPRVFPFTGSLYFFNHLVQVVFPLPPEETVVLAVSPVIIASLIISPCASELFDGHIHDSLWAIFSKIAIQLGSGLLGRCSGSERGSTLRPRVRIPVKNFEI